ncbi:hypothetical protein A3A05_00135 [Candidatus Nomurabacteria bacterium RIFCSPLOWO2_01_FULL_41_12]|uniref:Uncharacterized protein n=1 Tax=Candidatus Nomurabacteria bacterium RIFCSPLOWO2_01_FULL_41_12 TaxID=1801774 RepID=A0A1F6WXC0_9BACT|nr:MAG: hypothetical protein A2732_01160 [Candidatus Nomurabacteria bacterium RIFCSPHIGHO2_01_FULL_40_10]OGI86522.1 MAG: hypothetical protein A3A05_00135 [Candidatus Nomurabacteria bacterium RIFCSPLOWO2_01_FULL_41_12]
MGKDYKTKKFEIEYAKCVWGLLCSLSSVDQERNNISLFNVVEQINIPIEFFVQQKKENKNLVFPFSYEVVLCWRRTLDIGISNEEILADFKIKVVDPSGKILQEILSPLKFPKGIKRLRSRLVMQGMLASMAGDYAYHVEIKLPNQNDFEKVLEIPLEVREVSSPK